MNKKRYRTIDNLTGWTVFAIAAFTYCSTIEPTASYWDCPEFISSACKLEVGHPPGAPFFMLLGNLFSQLASDTSQIARMVNTMNALLSAGCILLLYWTITHFARKMTAPEGECPTPFQTAVIVASGICGSLIYCWSDTFWFSAVEGEVYAFSSFLTALVFWLILKWEDEADQPESDRWIVLIAYVIGLSIGVHLLGLLCLPAIAMVVYYRLSPKPSRRGLLLSLLAGGLLVGAVLYGIVPGVVLVGGWFELLAVNVLHLPFHTGLAAYVLLLTLLLLAAWFYTARDVSLRRLHLAVRCFAVLLVGYSTYAVILIRSSACPPMDENHPSDIFTLAQYLSREQYGYRPLLWGQTYRSQPDIEEHPDGTLTYAIDKGSPIYKPRHKERNEEPDRYEKTEGRWTLRYPASQCMPFPRVWSERHASLYEQWLGKTDTHPVAYRIPGNGTQTLYIPTWKENLRFFFTYQMGFMYWRYFLWNFAGRQNDIQGHGEREYGNWLSGIPWLDRWRLGDQRLLPASLQANKGRNLFFCLPLLLGLAGLWRQWRSQNRQAGFAAVLLLFVMTGLAIVVYLNQTPGQPRERDYAYAGSFYAFAIWCGLSMIAFSEGLARLLRPGRAAALLILIASLIVPLQMVSQTWDDHDRSHRYTCRDFGLNYLQTVPHDGVLFTNADNDTFPLWYLQDTEGVRTDVRVVNFEYLQTDWYVDQLLRPAYTGNQASSTLPITWSHAHYREGENEMIDVNPTLSGGKSMKELILQVYKDDPERARRLWGDDPFELTTVFRHFVLQEYEGLTPHELHLVRQLPRCLPTDTLRLTVDKEAVRRSGMMIPAEGIPHKMEISLAGQTRISKSYALLLETIGQTNFRRPLYIAISAGADHYGNLYRHFVLEGMAYRITPFTFASNHLEYGTAQTVIDTNRLYHNLMQRYRYGNAASPEVYLDETTLRTCRTHRRLFLWLIEALLQQGDKQRATLASKRMEQELRFAN